jgi:hypothetical protein
MFWEANSISAAHGSKSADAASKATGKFLNFSDLALVFGNIGHSDAEGGGCIDFINVFPSAE